MTASVLAPQVVPPAVQAAPVLFRGLNVEQIDAYEARIEAAVRAALRRVMRQITAKLGETITAAALVADASAISPDDLSGIGPLWHAQVEQQLQPVVAEVYHDAGGALHASLVDAVGDLPRVSSVAAETYLAQSATTFDAIGAQLWETARSELIDGMAAGEDIPTLAKRLRTTVPDLTARQATLVARTQVNDAANAGSYATAQASGLDLVKGWESTADLRTRETHLFAGGRYSGPGMILLAESFLVGGWPCERPHDPSLPPAERYNCRCTIVYAMREPGFEERQQEFRRRVEADLAEQRARREAALAAQQERLETSLEEQRRRLLESFEAIRRGIPLAQAVPDTGPAGRAVVGQATEVPVRASLQAASTIPELEAAFIAEWEQVLSAYPGAVRGTVSFYEHANLDTAREYAEGLLRGIEQVPKARFNVGHTPVYDSYAQTSGWTVEFSEAWSAARSVYLERLANDSSLNPQGFVWRPASTSSPQGIALHELGHALAYDLAPDPSGYGALHNAAYQVVRDLLRERGLGPDDFFNLIKTEIGEYAATNSVELLAEAFADAVINGEQASVLSRRIYAMVLRKYEQTYPGGLPTPATLRLPGYLPRPAAAPARMTPAEFEQHIAAAARGQEAVRTATPLDYENEATFNAAVGAELRQAVGQYRGIAFQIIQDDLRLDEIRAALSPVVQKIDRALAASVLRRDVVVYRGALARDVLGDQVDRSDLAGFVFREAGYTSTASDQAIGRLAANRTGELGLFMRIYVPRGVRGITLSKGEAELMLQRGLSFRVVADHGVEQFGRFQHRLLDVEVVPSQVVPLDLTPLGRAIGEALLQLDTGTDLADIVALFEGDPTLRKALLAARRTTDRDKLAASLRRLADREGVAIPTPAQLRMIKAAERKAAAKAKREAALAARAEKARLAEVKKQVKAVSSGDFRSLVQTDTGAYQAPDGTLWTVESFAASEREARERVLAMALQDLVDPARTGPAPLAVAGQGAPGPGGWQVAYAGTVPRAALTLDDWLGSASLDQLKKITPARLRALVAKVGLSPTDAERLVARRAEQLAKREIRLPLSQAMLRSMHRLDDKQSGMRARVSSISQRNDYEGLTGYEQFDKWPQVNVEILRGSGRVIDDLGYARILLSPDGRTVYFGALVLDAPVQGQGFVTRLMMTMFKRYRAAGIRTIGIQANADVGGYAWARAGFVFFDEKARRRFAEYARAYARGDSVKWYEPGGSIFATTRRRKLDRETIAAFFRVAGDPAAEPIDYAMIGYMGGSKMWPGKEFLLGSEWPGRMSI